MHAVTTSTNRRRNPPHRPLRLVVLLLVLSVLATVLVLLRPSAIDTLGNEAGSLLSRPDCVVRTPDGETGLDRAEAERATTAAALQARGVETPDTADLDEAVMQALAVGPSEGPGPVLSCRGETAEDLPEQALTDSGLTPRAEQVRTAMVEVFGEQSLGGFAPGGVGQGHGEESTHYDGRAIDVFFRPITEENQREGWLLAQWLVAHAGSLDIQYVIFDDQFWSARIARGQWHPYKAPAPANEILRHLDHVHVDVLGGGA